MDATPNFSSTATPDHRLGNLRMDRPRRPGGSSMGRLMWRSRTRTAGIRFEWVSRTTGPVLRVVATWTDGQGHARHTSFSVQCNGLEGALDRAIACRISCGAPMPDRADLLQRLQKEFETAPPHLPVVGSVMPAGPIDEEAAARAEASVAALARRQAAANSGPALRANG